MAAWGFIGGAYEAANQLQDAQALVNWYVELDQNDGAKTPKALLGCPGLKEAVSSSFTGEVRGCHVMPGRQVAYLVIGSAVVRMNIATQATVSTPATFTLTKVGTMVSSTGQVCMRDNGVAKILFIVDGASMYIVDSAGSFRVVSDENVIRPTRLAFIDGWVVFNSASTQKFNVTPVYWNGNDAFDGTFFALKDDASDNLVTLIEDERQLWLVGEETTEVWYNAGTSSVTGAASQPFSRLQGAMRQVGCVAPNTIARTGHGVCWLGASERGQNFVVKTEGYDFKNISSQALAYALTKYQVVSDAFAYVYTEEGHEFYVLTFPTQDVTWCYDFTTGLWHQRASFDGAVQHRSRANCLMNFAGQRIVGDYASGKVWAQSRSNFADGDKPLIALRRSPYVWDGDDRCRVLHRRLQIEFTPGVGLSAGQGSDPHVMFRWKDEGGWSSGRLVPIGKIGETRNRAISRKLGASRSRIYEVSISDPVARDVVGASLRVEGTRA